MALGERRGSLARWQLPDDGLSHYLSLSLADLPGSEQPASFTLRLQPLALTDIGRLLHNDALQGQVRLSLQVDGPPEAVQVSGRLLAEQGNVDVQGQVNRAIEPTGAIAGEQLHNVRLSVPRSICPTCGVCCPSQTL